MTAKTPGSRLRLWLMRFFAMIFIPLLVLGGLELGLRLGGFGYDTSFFREIQIKGQAYYVPNETFNYRFFPPSLARTIYPIQMPSIKPTNSYRIFLFGESAAIGDPDPSYGFGRYLQVLLRERYPGTDFEVIPVAMTAINSNVILPIARECAKHQGDLWLIYMGNNEIVGPFGAETTDKWRAPSLGMIRTILAFKSTRIGQLFDDLIRRLKSNSSAPKNWNGMEMFMSQRLGHDDPARLRAYANFKGNLEDVLRAAHKADVPVILSTMAVNLKDCSPFASIHAVDWDTNQETAWREDYEQGVDLETTGSYNRALTFYQEAAKLDPQFADLQFRMGKCDMALTNDNQARQEFELARDCDALGFRADARINSTITEEASRHAGQGVRLLDAATALAQSSPDGISGLELFYEHVHLNFTGNYLLALDFAKQVNNLLPKSIKKQDKGIWTSAEICDRRLAVTVWDRQRIWQNILRRISTPPFTGQFNHDASLKIYESKWNEAKSAMNIETIKQARLIYEQALALSPDDIQLLGNYEQFLEASGDLKQAIVEAQRICELTPQNYALHYYIGNLLVRAGRIGEAKACFSRALAIRSDYAEAQNAMGEILSNQKKNAEAIDWFKRVIRANPTYVAAYLNLGFLQQNCGDSPAASANYQKAANLEPNGPADYFNQANIAANQYRWDEAIACLRTATRVKPDFWQAHYQLGIQLAAKGEIEAQTEFLQTIRYRPDFVQAHLELGTVLTTQGKLEQALAEFHIVLQLDPANASAQQQIDFVESALHNSH